MHLVEKNRVDVENDEKIGNGHANSNDIDKLLDATKSKAIQFGDGGFGQFKVCLGILEMK